MARDWTRLNKGRGNVLRTDFKKGIYENTTIKPNANIFYAEVDVKGGDIVLTCDASESKMADEVRITIANTGAESGSLTLAGGFEDTIIEIESNEIEAVSFICNGSAFAMEGISSNPGGGLDYQDYPITQSSWSGNTDYIINGTFNGAEIGDSFIIDVSEGVDSNLENAGSVSYSNAYATGADTIRIRGRISSYINIPNGSHLRVIKLV